jgi:glyoxylase-like metal-dependent hydrolase (beta-lactamase superfamily II)
MIRPERIATGIESFAARTPTLPPATHTQSYALGTREILLVEPATPFEDERRDWLAWARGLRSQGRELRGLFVTHHHPDHVGGASFFCRELGVPLLGHRLTGDRLERGVRLGRTYEEGDALILDGPEPQRWEVLHTPGHAVGHLCLFERSLGQVVVGDMVASVGTILVAPGDGDMREYIAQLRRLGELPARLALPAHGAPIVEPSGLFAFYVQHRLMREDKVRRALRGCGRAGATVDELLPTVYEDTAETAYPLARLSLQAHLDKLVADGEVDTDGERSYAIDHVE